MKFLILFIRVLMFLTFLNGLFNLETQGPITCVYRDYYLWSFLTITYEMSVALENIEIRLDYTLKYMSM